MNDAKVFGIERAARYRMYMSFRYAELDKRNLDNYYNSDALRYARWASDLFDVAAILKGARKRVG